MASVTPSERHSTLGLHQYDVVYDGSGVLEVDACFESLVSPELIIDEGLDRFVDEVEVEAEGQSRGLRPLGGVWSAPECVRGPCRVHYRFALRTAARRLNDVGRALEAGEALVAPPSSWLMRPVRVLERDRYRLSVETPRGVRFVSGVERRASGPGFEAEAATLAVAPLSAFGPFEVETRAVACGTVDMVVVSGGFELGREPLFDWVTRAAENVAHYFRRFPRARVVVFLLPARGRVDVISAMTLGNGGASIAAIVGDRVSRETLDDDWQMTHEMVHVGFPNLPRAQHWLEEGLATYVEGVARARRGLVSSTAVWGELLDGVSNGIDGIRMGLDASGTWGSNYWGGALFYLFADLEIRIRTGGRRTLVDALRGIVEAGGNIATTWTLPRLLASADRATGVPVFEELYARLGREGQTIDLGVFWRSLGVHKRDGRVVFDERAPLAALRRSITDVAAGPRRDPEAGDLERGDALSACPEGD